MTREQAQSIVDLHVTLIDQRHKAISRSVAFELLGQLRFERLSRDRVRCAGPVAGTFYPWNVVDYLVNPELNARKYPFIHDWQI